ncbi:MAG TPA: Gfo/Idh/MocA family oxidoreductase [Bauldia sp.]|nr:Gfo/Idh/MocA family oxidoreductase [Bauldia sp.]
MRVAIFGSGYIARVHARVARELGGTVVAVLGRTRGAAEAFGVGAAYDDAARLLAEEKPDVVHICTPNRFHAEQAIAAFRAGAHVLCEKPLANSSDEARRMIEAADRAGRVGATMYNYRGYPVVETMRTRVRAGELGLLRRVGGCYLSEDVCPPEKYVWHFTPGAVGPAFALMDLGVHWFDLAEYVTGGRFTEILAQFSTHQPRRIWRGLAGEGPRPEGTELPDGGVAVDLALEDQADLLVRLDGGAAGSVTVSALSVGHPNSIRLSLDGADRGLDWHQQDPDFIVERTLDGATVRQRTANDQANADTLPFLPKGHPQGYLDAFRNVMASAWRRMETGTGVAPTFADGLRGLVLVEAAVRSASGKRAVAVPAP